MKFSIGPILSSILSITSPINSKLSEVYVCEKPKPKPKMITCDSKNPCPFGSKCVIIYGKSGLCVLMR